VVGDKNDLILHEDSVYLEVDNCIKGIEFRFDKTINENQIKIALINSPINDYTIVKNNEGAFILDNNISDFKLTPGNYLIFFGTGNDTVISPSLSIRLLVDSCEIE
jgi:hypothetical protein